MAFSVGKYNKENLFTFRLESDDFKKLSELEAGKGYRIRGLFISKAGKYGKHPVAVSDTFFIDLPKNQLETVISMMNDRETVDAINEGAVGISPEPYHSDKYDMDCVGVKWVDFTPDKK